MLQVDETDQVCDFLAANCTGSFVIAWDGVNSKMILCRRLTPVTEGGQIDGMAVAAKELFDLLTGRRRRKKGEMFP